MLIRARSGGASLRSRPAFGTYGVNYGSAQSQRLAGWMPMHGGVMYDLVQNIPFHRRGTTNVPCLSTELGLIPATSSASSVSWVNDETSRYNFYSVGVGRTAPYTICAWGLWDGSRSQTFATNGNGTPGSNYYGIEVAFGTTGLAVLQYGDGGGTGPADRRTYSTDSPVMTANVWTHLIWHCQSYEDWAIYVNGVAQAGSMTGTGAGNYNTATRPAGYGRTIGCAYAGGGGSLLTDLRLYRLETDTYPTAEWIANQYERPTDLYWQPSRRLWVQVTAAAAGVPKQMDNILRSTWA